MTKSEAHLALEYDRMMQDDPNAIFVFGSNLAGIHGAGAALSALKYGAQLGEGVGPVGRTYAIATKDRELRVLSPDRIASQVAVLLGFAESHPEFRFLVTRIGCGRAGYKDEDIAPMFKGASSNVILPEGWTELIQGD